MTVPVTRGPTKLPLAGAAVAALLLRTIAVAEPLTLDEVIARARTHAPAVLAAQARLAEARGRVAGAAILLRENPTIEGAAGPRMKSGGTILDADVGVSQMLETGGQRGARLASAEAGVARATAESEEAARQVTRLAASTFLRALYAEERLHLAQAAEAVVAEIRQVAERRFHAGDVATLEVNIATAALARARAVVHGQEAARDNAIGELRIVLGFDAEAPLTLQGDLRDRRSNQLEPLMTRIADRPDLRALNTEAQGAEADMRLGKAANWPDVGLGARYERDDGDNVALAGVTVRLPLFDRSQGLRAEAAARAARTRLAGDFARRAANVEVRTAFDVWRCREAAVVALEAGALPNLEDNQRLARRSYEAGQLSLAEFLLLQREILETRVDYLDRLLDAALAAIDLEASAGVLR